MVILNANASLHDQVAAQSSGKYVLVRQFIAFSEAKKTATHGINFSRAGTDCRDLNQRAGLARIAPLMSSAN